MIYYLGDRYAFGNSFLISVFSFHKDRISPEKETFRYESDLRNGSKRYKRDII